MADIYVSTTGNDSTGAGTSGNPYATPGKAASVMSADDRILVKADGVYNQASSIAMVSGSTDRSRIEGYTATPGDGGVATIKKTSGTGSLLAYATDGNSIGVSNLILDANSTANIGLDLGNYLDAHNVWVKNSNTYGTTFGHDCHLTNTRVTGAGSSAAFYSGSSNNFLLGCFAKGYGYGFQADGTTIYAECIASNCTIYGFFSNGGYMTVVNGVAYASSSSGIRCSSANIFNCLFMNCILANNGGYGIDGVTAVASQVVAYANAFYKNTSGEYHNANAGIGDIAQSVLTLDPFVDAANDNFALNNAASGGALLRAAGFPGTFPGGATVGYRDIGAVQHQDSGGGTAGMLYHTGGG